MAHWRADVREPLNRDGQAPHVWRPAGRKHPFLDRSISSSRRQTWVTKGVSAGTLLRIFPTLLSEPRAREAKSYACFSLNTSWHEACSKAGGISYTSQEVS